MIGYPRSTNNRVINNRVEGSAMRHGVLLQYSAHHNLVESNTVVWTTYDAFDLAEVLAHLAGARHRARAAEGHLLRLLQRSWRPPMGDHLLPGARHAERRQAMLEWPAPDN
jgi:parallel beta-helix repeat protein